MKGFRAFWAVEEECSFAGFDGLGLARLKDPRCSCVAGFARRSQFMLGGVQNDESDLFAHISENLHFAQHCGGGLTAEEFSQSTETFFAAGGRFGAIGPRTSLFPLGFTILFPPNTLVNIQTLAFSNAETSVHIDDRQCCLLRDSLVTGSHFSQQVHVRLALLISLI